MSHGKQVYWAVGTRHQERHLWAGRVEQGRDLVGEAAKAFRLALGRISGQDEVIGQEGN